MFLTEMKHHPVRISQLRPTIHSKNTEKLHRQIKDYGPRNQRHFTGRATTNRPQRNLSRVNEDRTTGKTMVKKMDMGVISFSGRLEDPTPKAVPEL